MAVPPGINDDFQLEGFWWLPDKPDLLVAGEMTFSQKDGPVLTLTGTLNPDQKAFLSELEDRPTIHGHTKDGKAVSLFGALHTQRKGNLGSPAVREVYKCHLLAVGHHFASDDDPIFARSYVSFEGIEEWFGHRFFDLQYDADGSKITLNLNRARDKPLAQIEGVTLHSGSGFHTGSSSSTDYSISASCYVKVVPDQARSLSWHMTVAAKIQALASLCTGRHLPLRSIMLDGPDRRHSPEHTRSIDVRVYAQMIYAGSQKSQRFQKPLVALSDLPVPADGVFQRWFDSYDELDSSIYLYLTALADRALFINARFSIAVQALEVFHRRVSPGALVAKEEHEALQRALIAAIPEGTAPAMREKLKLSTLPFSNEPSLRQRLRRLMEEVVAQFGESPAGFGGTFFGRLVDTRNYYTHYSPELEGRTLKGADMHYAIRRIVLLLTMLLMVRIGVDPATVRAAINRHREFKQLWEKEGNPT